MSNWFWLEVTAQLWLHQFPLYKPEEDETSTDEVLDFIMGIYALERIGIAHDSKEEIRSTAKKLTVNELFGCDGKIFRQIATSFRNPPMEWRDYTNALTYSFYATKTGIDLHIDLTTVVKLLPAYRPYKAFKRVDKDEYACLISTLLFKYLIYVLVISMILRISSPWCST